MGIIRFCHSWEPLVGKGDLNLAVFKPIFFVFLLNKGKKQNKTSCGP